MYEVWVPKECTQQNKPYSLRGQNASRQKPTIPGISQKYETSVSEPRHTVWSSLCHQRAIFPYLQASWGRLAVSRVLENLPCRSMSSVKSNFSVRNLPASWTTTKCLTLAGLYTPRPPRQQKLHPERFIRFLLQTWTSPWYSA